MNTIRRVVLFAYFCMNYLDYVNCVDGCLEVGFGKFIQMLTFAENTHIKRVWKLGKRIFIYEEKKKNTGNLDYFSYDHSLPTIL